ERELFRLGRIRDVVEGLTGLWLVVGRRLRRIVAQVIVVINYQDLLLTIDAQVIAPRARIAWNERELLHVPWIADIRNDDSEQRLRIVIAGEIADAVVHTHRVEA